MQLVDEHDVLAFVLCQFLQHILQTLFKLAAIFRPRQQSRHVQREYALTFQRFRHFVVDDALRQALHNRGLAHAGFADQHRVVFGAALQHLNGAADFVVAAYHRVEFALAGALGQVEAVFFQRLALAFSFGIFYRRATAHRVDGGFQRGLAHAVLLQQTTGFALVVAGGQQEHFRGNELVAALLRRLVGQVEQIAQVAPDLHLAAVAVDFGQTLDGLRQRRFQRRHLPPGPRQQRPAIGIVGHGLQQMQRFDELIVRPDRQTLGIRQGLLQLGRKLVKTHDGSP